MLGLLSASDRITLNRDRLLLDARAQAAALADAGYASPSPRTGIPAPGLAALGALETEIFLMGEAGFPPNTIRGGALGCLHPAGGRVTAGSLITSNICWTLSARRFSRSAANRSPGAHRLYLKTGKPLCN